MARDYGSDMAKTEELDGDFPDPQPTCAGSALIYLTANRYQSSLDPRKWSSTA